MSNIGSKDNSLGKKYELVIANGTEEVFQQLKKLNIYNKVIISIPTNSETGEDLPDEASVWMTDSKGKLYQLAKPINKISLTEDKINEILDEKLNEFNTTILNKVDSLGVDDLKNAFSEILTNEKNNLLETLKQYVGINEQIEKETQLAHEKINSINKKLDQDINKIIWNCPNIAYLSHIVRTLCGFHNIQYEFDNEYSESEVLHTEHHNLIQKIEELEQRLDELENNGH